MDESCPHCGGMTVAGLRTRLRFLQRGGVPVPLPRSRVPPGGYRGEATSDSSRAGLTVTVRNSPPKTARAPPVTGGAARGYTEVPPVERSVAMQLCPRTASTWRGNPLLPSRAGRHSSALTGSAYAACGEAASALHAMALLQVHQAKALRDLHEGGHDPGILSELRTAMDLALRATKVTAWSLGRAMSTMVVQERHLWLSLADMKEVDKARFLNAPVSQTGLFGDAVENFAQPPAKQRRGAGRRAATPPVQAPAKPGGKRRSKRP